MNDPPEGVKRRDLFLSAWDADDFAPPSASVRVEFGTRSHRGRVPTQNDDHHLVLHLERLQEALFTSLSMRDVAKRFVESAYLAVVADGIGGGGAGAVAARMAVGTLAELGIRFGRWQMRIDAKTSAEIMDRSKWYLQGTHVSVLQHRLAHPDLADMATTLTAFYSAGSDLFVAHVGHSRCYLFRNGVLAQLTIDQTLREHFANGHRPAAVEQALKDVQHILTEAIGAQRTPGVAVEHFALLNDDCVLLCTNGLTDMVDDEAIADVLAARRSPQEECDLLIDKALANGGQDNVTVVIAHYDIP